MIDYCNSLLYYLASKDILKLQCVRNCLSRVVTRSPRCSHFVPLLKSLHWLPVHSRIIFKLCTNVYEIRAFSVAVPNLWNSLPEHGKSPNRIVSFRHDLVIKMDLFNLKPSTKMLSSRVSLYLVFARFIISTGCTFVCNQLICNL